MSEQHTVQQLHFHWKDKYILKLLLFPPLFPLPALLYNSLEEPRTGKERGEEEQRGAAPLTSHQRGETQWLRSHQLYASCSSCSPSLPPVPLPFSPSSSRLPPLLPSHLLSFSASPSCLTGSVCSGPSSHSPLLCDPLCFHQSLTCKNIVCFGDSFLCHLVKKSLKPLALKKW